MVPLTELRVIGAMRSALADNPDPKAADLRADLAHVTNDVTLRSVQEACGLLGVSPGSFFESEEIA